MDTLVRLLGVLKTVCFPAGTVEPHSAAAVKSPTARRPRRVITSQAFRRTILHVYLSVLLLANGLLIYVGGELIDLYVSSVELWAELARKHLELTL